jgi:hypothetical protein
LLERKGRLIYLLKHSSKTLLHKKQRKKIDVAVFLKRFRGEDDEMRIEN